MHHLPLLPLRRGTLSSELVFLLVIFFPCEAARAPIGKTIVSTVAGTGEANFVDGPAISAAFNDPTDVVVDRVTHAAYIADRGNHAIRRLDQGGGQDSISTVARTDELIGCAGKPTCVGPYKINVFPTGAYMVVSFFDNQHALNISLWHYELLESTVRIIVIDTDFYMKHNAMFATDHTPSRIYLLNGEEISVLAGSISRDGFDDGKGSGATFHNPSGIAFDFIEEKIYVTDTDNHAIRKISLDGTVTTLTGQGIPGHKDGDFSEALFDSPLDLSFIPERRLLLISDTGNSVIRAVNLDTGDVSTIAGVPKQPGYKDGPGQVAQFRAPNGIDYEFWPNKPGPDSLFYLYVSDPADHRIRKVTILPPYIRSYLQISPSEPQTITLPITTTSLIPYFTECAFYEPGHGPENSTCDSNLRIDPTSLAPYLDLTLTCEPLAGPAVTCDVPSTSPLSPQVSLTLVGLYTFSLSFRASVKDVEGNPWANIVHTGTATANVTVEAPGLCFLQLTLPPLDPIILPLPELSINASITRVCESEATPVDLGPSQLATWPYDVGIQWRLASGAPLKILGSTNTTMQARDWLYPGTYTFEVVVTARPTANWVEEMTVTQDLHVVALAPPPPSLEIFLPLKLIPDAPLDFVSTTPAITATFPSGSSFNFSLASPPDQSNWPYNISHVWSQVSGPRVVLKNITQPQLVVPNLVPGLYSFQVNLTGVPTTPWAVPLNAVGNLTVDAQGVVLVTRPKKVLEIPPNSWITLYAELQNPGDTLLYAKWEQLDKCGILNVSNPEAPFLHLYNPPPGTYAIQATVEASGHTLTKSTQVFLVAVLDRPKTTVRSFIAQGATGAAAGFAMVGSVVASNTPYIEGAMQTFQNVLDHIQFMAMLLKSTDAVSPQILEYADTFSFSLMQAELPGLDLKSGTDTTARNAALAEACRAPKVANLNALANLVFLILVIGSALIAHYAIHLAIRVVGAILVRKQIKNPRRQAKLIDRLGLPGALAFPAFDMSVFTLLLNALALSCGASLSSVEAIFVTPRQEEESEIKYLFKKIMIVVGISLMIFSLLYPLIVMVCLFLGIRQRRFYVFDEISRYWYTRDRYIRLMKMKRDIETEAANVDEDSRPHVKPGFESSSDEDDDLEEGELLKKGQPSRWQRFKAWIGGTCCCVVLGRLTSRIADTTVWLAFVSAKRRLISRMRRKELERSMVYALEAEREEVRLQEKRKQIMAGVQQASFRTLILEKSSQILSVRTFGKVFGETIKPFRQRHLAFIYPPFLLLLKGVQGLVLGDLSANELVGKHHTSLQPLIILAVILGLKLFFLLSAWPFNQYAMNLMCIYAATVECLALIAVTLSSLNRMGLPPWLSHASEFVCLLSVSAILGFLLAQLWFVVIFTKLFIEELFRTPAPDNVRVPFEGVQFSSDKNALLQGLDKYFFSLNDTTLKRSAATSVIRHVSMKTLLDTKKHAIVSIDTSARKLSEPLFMRHYLRIYYSRKLPPFDHSHFDMYFADMDEMRLWQRALQIFQKHSEYTEATCRAEGFVFPADTWLLKHPQAQARANQKPTSTVRFAFTAAMARVKPGSKSEKRLNVPSTTSLSSYGASSSQATSHSAANRTKARRIDGVNAPLLNQSGQSSSSPIDFQPAVPRSRSVRSNQSDHSNRSRTSNPSPSTTPLPRTDATTPLDVPAVPRAKTHGAPSARRPGTIRAVPGTGAAVRFASPIGPDSSHDEDEETTPALKTLRRINSSPEPKLSQAVSKTGGTKAKEGGPPVKKSGSKGGDAPVAKSSSKGGDAPVSKSNSKGGNAAIPKSGSSNRPPH